LEYEKQITIGRTSFFNMMTGLSNLPPELESHADHILATFKKTINWARPRSSCRSRAALIAASAAATLSRFAHRRPACSEKDVKPTESVS
jgi:hypothetical protein